MKYLHYPFINKLVYREKLNIHHYIYVDIAIKYWFVLYITPADLNRHCFFVGKPTVTNVTHAMALCVRLTVRVLDIHIRLAKQLDDFIAVRHRRILSPLQRAPKQTGSCGGEKGCPRPPPRVRAATLPATLINARPGTDLFLGNCPQF